MRQMWGLTWKHRLLDLLLPETCVGCLEDLPPPLGGPLCGRCLKLLRRFEPRFRPATRFRSGPLAVVCAAFPYRAPLPAVVHSFKYRRRLSAGRTLAAWMAGAWHRHPELGRADALVPVPLHPARERERGFNQALVLARAVAASARTPVIEPLARVENTAPQARRRRSDRPALKTAFRAGKAAGLAGARLVLIDDVYTSGRTLEGCARTLRASGAADVSAFVLACSHPSPTGRDAEVRGGNARVPPPRGGTRK
ncbi:MAG: phosphoribosyltransferase family protein [Elusimicrobiota bacterium]